MVRDFESNFKEYLSHLMDEAHKALRYDNYAFMQLEECEKKLYEKAENIIKSLPNEKQEVLKSFIGTFGMVAGHEAEHMYYQGIKDSVRFLKFLQVI